MEFERSKNECCEIRGKKATFGIILKYSLCFDFDEIIKGQL